MALLLKTILFGLLSYRVYLELPEDELLRKQYIGCSIILILLLILCHFGKRRRLFRPQKVSKINRMSERNLVNYLHTYFSSRGYTVEAIPAKGNFGADLILSKWGRKTVVRIRKSDKSVGLSAVQEVAGALGYHQANKAIVITTGKYTKAARRLAITNHIQAWDKDTLLKKKIMKGG